MLVYPFTSVLVSSNSIPHMKLSAILKLMRLIDPVSVARNPFSLFLNVVKFTKLAVIRGFYQ